MTQTKQSKHQPTELSKRIRVLLKEGRTPAEIMALTGAKRHIVGLVKYHMERQENIRISPITGKPVRKYTKRKAKKSLAERGAELRQWAAERTELPPVPAEPQVKYIEIEVPQPHYSLTWGQRFKALFTGRV